MGKFNSFEEINSWQKARIFNKRIYQITENLNFKKDYDFVRQIRRASISISSNIAEGFERNTDKEFIRIKDAFEAIEEGDDGIARIRDDHHGHDHDDSRIRDEKEYNAFPDEFPRGHPCHSVQEMPDSSASYLHDHAID